MIFRIFPIKDTWITNIGQPVALTPTTGSNFGASEILEVFKTGPSGTITIPGAKSYGRSLLQFDHTQLPTGSGLTYSLKLFDARHSDPLPFSYDLSIHQVTRTWDEGRGLDEDTFQDLGFANWVQPQNGQYWATQGGDFVAGQVSSFHLDDGHESPTFDVTSLVNAWLSGTTNNGLMVKVSSTLEADTQDYYVKRFHGRLTNFLDRRPYIQATWDDSVLTGSGQTFATSGSAIYVVDVVNLKSEYEIEETPQLRLFVRTTDYNPAVVNTGSSVPPNLVVTRGYYRIDNDRTKEHVVGFGTGSYQGGTDSTRLSYDSNGNYFTFPMSNLSPGEVYRIVFLFDVGGQKQTVDGGFKFRIAP